MNNTDLGSDEIFDNILESVVEKYTNFVSSVHTAPNTHNNELTTLLQIIYSIFIICSEAASFHAFSLTFAKTPKSQLDQIITILNYLNRGLKKFYKIGGRYSKKWAQTHF